MTDVDVELLALHEPSRVARSYGETEGSESRRARKIEGQLTFHTSGLEAELRQLVAVIAGDPCWK